ncbi:MAG: iron-containing alcohol dehydrogenase [Acidobacteria bacterium]|nr:iron-containing alcohol dehydrogenase [Acidobacteriota bacterium]
MMIEGQTNVLSLRTGGGCLTGVGRELGRFVVTTMEIPWSITKDLLGATPEAVLMVESMEQEVVERQIALAPECDTVLAIGGGQAIDLGKYFSWKRGIRLVTAPTILSVDAFTTPAAGLRQGHRVIYLGHASPDPLVIDYDVIRTAPPELNIAGVGDLFSIHTASFDWKLAESAGKSEYPFSANTVSQASGIIEMLRNHKQDIRECNDEGLWAIVEGCMRLNTICLPAGHFRVEEGSEHYLFYELEERLQRPFTHGHIVGLGIHLMSRLQNNSPAEITGLLNEVGLLYQPRVMGITRTALTASLLNLRSYVESRKDLWHTVINQSSITQEWIEEAIEGLEFVKE